MTIFLHSYVHFYVRAPIILMCSA